ncbi:HNH endonuclease family protein [Corynebacterium sp. H127]|uniref:HNH endonuclease family protein n=1 Tax=Corynebacterium sp. H127 TaxID=3133418 RepID=UPI0030B677D6
MTPSRLLLFTLILFTCLLLFLDRPVFPTNAPALSATLPHIPRAPQRQSVHGYEREAFSDWAPTLIDGHSCTTRTQILTQAFAAPAAADCSVTPTPGIKDPYSGAELSNPVEIDHIFPLRAAWDLGAHSWTPETRARFANDPSNLVAVSKEANQAKSDLLPSQWLPSRTNTRCWYSRRLAHVAATYQLALPTADIRVMQQACSVSEFPGVWLR